MMNLGMIAMMLLEDMLGKQNKTTLLNTPAGGSNMSPDFSKYLMGNPSGTGGDIPFGGIQGATNYAKMNPVEMMKLLLG